MRTIPSIETATDPSTMTRRLFAGGTLAALMAAGLSLPAAAEGLKEVNDDRDAHDEEDEIPEEWEELGVTSEHSYESPQFGFSIEWADPWKIDDADPGESNPVEAMDSLNLLRNVHALSGDGCYILGVPSFPVGLHGYHEPLFTEEGRREWFPKQYEAELLLSNENDVAIEFLLRLTTSSAVIILFLQCTEVTSDTWVMTTMVAGDDTIEDVFNGLKDQVLLNGESIVALTTWRDAKRAMR